MRQPQSRRPYWLVGLLLSASALVLPAPASPQVATLTEQQAKKLLTDRGFTLEPSGLLDALTSEDMLDVVEAYLAIGVPANRPIAFTDVEGAKQALPLNYMLRFACEAPGKALAARRLIEAGADAGVRDNDDRGWTPAIATVRCPHVLREILAATPDLTITDTEGRTLMSYAVVYGDPKLEVVRMLLDAGYDVAAERGALLKQLNRDDADQAVARLLAGMPPAPPGRRTTTSAPAPPPDWASPGPYPSHTTLEAARLLSRPGDDRTVDDHFWDGITGMEPLRLALALEAGANVEQREAATRYTPLVRLASRCDHDDDIEQQVSIAQQLVAAGADRTGVDEAGANALVLAAGECPAGVVEVLLKAGLAPTSVAADGDTPLKRAIWRDRADIVALLLDAGVDPRKEPYNVGRFASGKKEIEALLKRKR